MTTNQKLYSALFFRLFLCLCLISPPSLAARDVLFEGYHKVLSGKKHVGFSISRFEYDPSSKKFYATIFTKVGALGGNMMESIKAISDQKLTPVSYEYTTLVTENNKTVTKTIQADFKKVKLTKKERDALQKKMDAKKAENFLKEINNRAPTDVLRMNATVKDAGQTTKIIDDMPPGTFLSYFLVYLMLKSNTGIQTSSRYEYTAIAEEKPKMVYATATVRNEEDFLGFKAYKIENKFNGQVFDSYVTDKGNILGIKNPPLSIESELMAKPNEAVGDFSVPASVLKSLFGDVPLGVNNIASARLQAEALKPMTEPPGSKNFGAPAGSGIQTKSQAPTIETIEKPVPTGKEKGK